ncbi:phosphatase PAP2 family protein [Rugosimonospora acidiphila]|uniref:Phosphatase PAP2 family protein n=1 Tax=Rugosimonospora acidiphila TaxID=556531 RepID=A0ABP9SNQ5_9ACTN
MAAIKRVRPASWWFDGLLLAAFVAITIGVANHALIGIDVALRDWFDHHRPGVLYWPAWVGNHLGQGGWLTSICGILALLLAWRRRSVRPVLPVIVAFALTFGVLTPLKDLTDRPAADANVVHAGRAWARGYFGVGGVSYPSGHLVNSIVWYGLLALLLTAWVPVGWRRVIRVVPPSVLAVTTVYLSFHWLTDTVAGLLLGLVLDRIMHRIPWDDLPLGRRLAAAGWAGPGLGTGRPADPRGGRSPELAGRR